MSLKETEWVVDVADIQKIKMLPNTHCYYHVSPRLNLGCRFDNQFYLIPGAVQNNGDDGVDVGDVDFAIAIHVGSSIVIIYA